VTIGSLDSIDSHYSAFRMAIEDHYKYLRRRIARCGVLDSLRVIWAYSQFLQVRDFSFPDDIEKHVDFRADSRVNYIIHEWELETLATEVILHAGRGTKTMRDWSTARHDCPEAPQSRKRTVWGQRQRRHLHRDGAYYAQADIVATVSTQYETAVPLSPHLQRPCR